VGHKIMWINCAGGYYHWCRRRWRGGAKLLSTSMVCGVWPGYDGRITYRRSGKDLPRPCGKFGMEDTVISNKTVPAIIYHDDSGEISPPRSIRSQPCLDLDTKAPRSRDPNLASARCGRFRPLWFRRPVQQGCEGIEDPGRLMENVPRGVASHMCRCVEPVIRDGFEFVCPCQKSPRAPYRRADRLS
jgi:hypothetical protein